MMLGDARSGDGVVAHHEPRPESCWALTLLVDLDGDYERVDVKTGLAEVCAEMASLRERLSAADV